MENLKELQENDSRIKQYSEQWHLPAVFSMFLSKYRPLYTYIHTHTQIHGIPKFEVDFESKLAIHILKILHNTQIKETFFGWKPIYSVLVYFFLKKHVLFLVNGYFISIAWNQFEGPFFWLQQWGKKS